MAGSPGRESGHARRATCEEVVQAGRGVQGRMKELGLRIVGGAARGSGREVFRLRQRSIPVWVFHTGGYVASAKLDALVLAGW